MVDLEWLSDRLCTVLRWQLANPGAGDHPDAPEVPWAGRRIWSMFTDLNGARAVGFAPNPISMGDIDAYSRLRREPVRPFELDILRALDDTFLDAARDAAGRESDPAKPVVSSQPMTPSLFNALFSPEKHMRKLQEKAIEMQRTRR